jgi:hypothetical protein
MMRFRRWILLSLASVVLVGYTGEVSKSQIIKNSIPATSHVVARLTEPIAQTMTSTKPEALKYGTFASGEHPTQGTVRIISQNGKSFLELDQGFKTSNLGPDLVVALHRSSDVLGSTKPPSYPLKSGDYIVLAPLRKFSGAQRYAIPANVNLANYKSAVIWCRKFNATFGAAKLTNQ